MKRLIPRAVGLAILISALLVNSIYADVTSARMTDTHGGPEKTQFASGISMVYLVIEYSDMANEEIMVRVYDNVGTVLFEQEQTYTGSGMESVPISLAGGGAFPDGRYVTNLYKGLFPAKTIIWEVSAGTGTATPTSIVPTATATAVPSTSTPTLVPPTYTPPPPTATPTPMPPTPTLKPGQPTPTPVPPTPTLTPEQPYPAHLTPVSPTPTLAPEQPTLPMATVTEAALTPTSTTVPPAATPITTTATVMSTSPTPLAVLPTPTTTLAPKFTPVPTVNIDTTGGTKNFLAIAGYGGVAVVLVFLALFLWQRRSS